MFPTSSRLGLAEVCPSAAIVLEMAAQACPSGVGALEFAIRTFLAAGRPQSARSKWTFALALVPPKCAKWTLRSALLPPERSNMAAWVCNGGALISNRLEGCAQKCCITNLAGTTKIYTTTLCFAHVFFLESSICVFPSICFRISQLSLLRFRYVRRSIDNDRCCRKAPARGTNTAVDLLAAASAAVSLELDGAVTRCWWAGWAGWLVGFVCPMRLRRRCQVRRESPASDGNRRQSTAIDGNRRQWSSENDG